MKYFMKLCKEPFNAIKNGGKTVEMRLFDERRKPMKVGDEIEFTLENCEEKIYCVITFLKTYKNFNELYKCYNKTDIGYKADEDANPKDMLKYYKEEDIEKYGALAIGIKIL